jgi:hypothetical protein
LFDEEFKNTLEPLKTFTWRRTTHLIEDGMEFLSKSNFIYAARMLHSHLQEEAKELIWHFRQFPFTQSTGRSTHLRKTDAFRKIPSVTLRRQESAASHLPSSKVI